MATFMVYLNDVPLGGHFVFVQAGTYIITSYYAEEDSCGLRKKDYTS